MKDFWLCFVPLFVAVDAFGVIPLFLSLTEGLESRQLRKVVVQSVITAASVAIIFLVFGPALLSYLGITVADFMIAGGVLLLVISLSDLLTGEKIQRQIDADSVGAVPIGIPLIAGPALLTSCILLANTYGKMITSTAVIANIVLAGIIFAFAKPISRLMGRTGTKTISKVASLLLAAIAVMLIRRGIFEAIITAGS